MPSPEAVRSCWKVLRAQGYAPPKAWRRDEAADYVEAWCAVLADMSDEQLMSATLAYSRGGAEFWPRPGQLLQAVHAQADNSDELWGRLRALKAKHRSNPPLAPDAPDPWEIEGGARLAFVLRRAIDAARGWMWLHHADATNLADAAEQGHRALRDHYRAHRLALTPLAKHPGWSRFRGRTTPPDPEKVENLRVWLEEHPPQAVASELRRLMAEHGADDPPRQPNKPAPWRLHEDPATERAMWAGLEAVGGWREVWGAGDRTLQGHPNLASGVVADRASFRAAVRSTAARARAELVSPSHQLDGRNFDALVDSTGAGLALLPGGRR